MSSSAGGIGVFLLLAVGLPAATVAFTRLIGGAHTRRTRTADSVETPAPLPSWVTVSIDRYLATVVLMVLVVVVLVAVVWAVALHVLDKGYALAELLVFVGLVASASAYGWIQGVLRANR